MGTLHTLGGFATHVLGMAPHSNLCKGCGMTTKLEGTIPSFTMADRLKKAREVTGLEQVEFADRAGIGRSTVINYERGHTVPRPVYLRAWADASGVDLHWLETGEAPDVDAGASNVYYSRVA
jgi:ribosome-binding protein aMBF1 (putative translation factor)